MSASACWRIATPDPNTLSWPAIALQLLWGVRELVTIAVSIALPLTEFDMQASRTLLDRNFCS